MMTQVNSCRSGRLHSRENETRSLPARSWTGKNTPRSFDSLSLVDETEKNLTGDGEPERIKGLAMSARGLEMLRVRPVLGRTFTPQEDQVGSEKVIVLTHRFWTRRFGGNPGVIGQTLQLSDQTYAVIGVLPPRSLLWEEAEFV